MKILTYFSVPAEKEENLQGFWYELFDLFFAHGEFSILKNLVIQSIFPTKLMKAFKINIKIHFMFYINEHIAFISLYKSRYKNLLYEWNYMCFDSTKKGILWDIKNYMHYWKFQFISN